MKRLISFFFLVLLLVNGALAWQAGEKDACQAKCTAAGYGVAGKTATESDSSLFSGTFMLIH